MYVFAQIQNDSGKQTRIIRENKVSMLFASVVVVSARLLWWNHTLVENNKLFW